MILTVARIGRAHGLRGEVSVELRTDVPEERFEVGARLDTDPAGAGPLTVARAREQGGRWFLSFDEVTDREGADGLRGVLLTIDSDDDGDDEDDAWYVHELVGLRVERPDGTVIGEVTGLEHLPAHDLLVVRESAGATSRIPLVEALVPEVDIDGGRVVADPPYGLLAGEQAEEAR